MTMILRPLLVVAALIFVVQVDAFVPPREGKAMHGSNSPLSPSLSRVSESARLFYKHLDDDEGSAERLPLTTADILRLTEMRSRHQTIPIMILDAMLPGQRLHFGSDDPRFGKLLEYVLSEDSAEMGMIGLNPHTGRPLNIGVTLTVKKENMHYNPLTKMVTLTAKGGRRFEVQGEPWMDETDSFYMAEVEIVDNREETMSEEDEQTAKRLDTKIPDLFESWLTWVIKSGKSTTEEMEKRIKDLGSMPKEIGKRAMWVAAMVNSSPSLEVCVEVRPAMLACHNDFQRTNLAVIALQSSIDHLSGKRRLF
eukprot:CAMPEP_0197434634 /NCGR_PEP_ID=MMETSP1175-20131217/2340_1 /TAXON_ID=1003142 /ORGANISM="Triceratium dubium, Strain CCMP147" /LENGTH=308 /DNA_ID=CAMNT_0042963425 /DNA_START=18 /DNA_END=944 /DNA_ORIENTATION=+